MPITTHTPGSFCTSVLRTRDLERAAAFYSSLVGWTMREVGKSPDHRLVQAGDHVVASMQSVGTGPDCWVPHVSVESLDGTRDAAVALGASVLEATAAAGLAGMTTIVDPEGALFGLWQPTPHQGAQLTEEVGSLWWVEVLSNDIAGARDFYRRLFGWTCRETSFAPFASYTVFERGTVQEGGAFQIPPDWGVSPRWNSIFAVADADATIAQATRLGAREDFVHTVPTAGRIAGLVDPGGASFIVRGPVP